MKKVLLTAVAFVAFAGTAYASNGVKVIKINLPAEKVPSECIAEEDPNYPCVFTITIKDPKGGIISKEKIKATTYDPQGCCEYADFKVAQKKKDLGHGQTISHDLI